MRAKFAAAATGHPVPHVGVQRAARAFGSSIALVFLVTGAGADPNEPPAWSRTKPFVLADRFQTALAIEILQTKMFFEIELGGKARRLVFDTGTPTILDKSLARELGLTILDHVQSVDAHGAAIQNDLRHGFPRVLRAVSSGTGRAGTQRVSR